MDKPHLSTPQTKSRDRSIYGNGYRKARRRAFARSEGVCQGSIPACAGDPDRGPGAQEPNRVYPRVCGGSPSYNAAGHAPKVIARIAGARPGRRRPACPGAR